MKKWNRPRRTALRPTARLGLLALLVSSLPACASDSVFEGEPTVAPPLTAFDRATSADRAIHGGILPISVTASDPYVGIDSVVVRYSGAMSGAFTRRYATPPRQVRIDTVFQVPFGTQGEVVFEAFALNKYESTAEIDTLLVQITRTDTIRPGAAVQSAALPQRAELSGTMSFTVSAQDDQFGGGLAFVGAAVRTPTGLVEEVVAVAGLSSATREIVMHVSELTATAPQALSVEYFVFAVDQAGNCSATGAGGARVSCTFANGQLTIPAGTGVSATLQVTATVTAPQQIATTGDGIGDLVIDASRKLVYVSNTPANAVEAFSWSTPTAFPRTSRAFVGAAPLGMTIENGGGRLIVANSGGTSLSYVSLGGELRETSRYETPNAVLWQLTPSESIDTLAISDGDSTILVIDTVETVLTEYTDFSDRPQSVAQDAAGVIFYSTQPTRASQLGAVRRVEQASSWPGPEAGIMLWSQVVDGNQWGPGVPPDPCYVPDPATGVLENRTPCVITYIDSMKIVYESPFTKGTVWDVWDHVPGRPDQRIHIRSNSLAQIESVLRQNGSDAFIYHGSWNFEYWLTGERTFVTSSGDRSWVNFAEQEAGRVWNWGTIGNPARLYDRFISHFLNISDYMNNASDRITGVSVNHVGSLFVSRSQNGVYFFTNPLRLLGSYSDPDIGGGTGIALHPSAVGGLDASNRNADWAAVGTANPEIALIDTRNFRRVGTIPLLEPVGGPLRVTGAVGEDPANVVGHIFGVTKSGSVFHVAVRSSDINP